MKSRDFVQLLAVIALFSLGASTSALGQQPGSTTNVEPTNANALAAEKMQKVKLFDSGQPHSSPNVSRGSFPSAAEIRQARALYRARQRTARLERNLWLGYEPLRPSWNGLPMMSSRYAPPRIVIPVFVP
ncbi:MAG: hypothetical protein MI861_00355 [Pirellulales bacterium]|nr:hypothetical protein [Pirellulales bacterium]